ncbi:MAG: FeoA domain protein [Spirochaetes bacterium ADurb.Bin315]|jgi:ferrous iron transport protein A|nr:MAG: FeoA domain protein [Spirochaetes bacterium ADurb.Bin315]HOE89583.1 FeoA family protein [Sphaerochaeta sp.]
MTTLNKVNAGRKVVVSDVKGDQRFLSRITSVGLTIGCELEILHNEKKLPLLFYGRDTVVALNREESKNVFVEVIR